MEVNRRAPPLERFDRRTPDRTRAGLLSSCHTARSLEGQRYRMLRSLAPRWTAATPNRGVSTAATALASAATATATDNTLKVTHAGHAECNRTLTQRPHPRPDEESPNWTRKAARTCWTRSGDGTTTSASRSPKSATSAAPTACPNTASRSSLPRTASPPRRLTASRASLSGTGSEKSDSPAENRQ